MTTFDDLWGATVGNSQIDAIAVGADADQIGAMLRISFFYERIVEECLRRLLPSYALSNVEGFRYSAKIELLSAFGLRPETTQYLRSIAKLRNDAAHRDDFVLDEKRVQNLINGNHQFLQRAEARKQIPAGWTKARVNSGPYSIMVILAVSTLTIVEDCADLLSVQGR